MRAMISRLLAFLLTLWVGVGFALIFAWPLGVPW